MAAALRLGEHVAFPHRYELAYRRLAEAEVAAVSAEVLAAVTPALPVATRTDNIDLSTLLSLFAALESLRSRAVTKARAAATYTRQLLDLARGVVSTVDLDLRLQVRGVLGIDVVTATINEQDLARWAASNANLITSIRGRAVSDLHRWLPQALREGWTTREVTTEIRRRVEGIEGWRARFWARDQVGKLNGDITRQKQTDLGILSYQWVDSGDERVRASHRANDGRVFLWSQPPASTGHPGHDYQCRCTARPVFAGTTVAELRRRHEERMKAEATRRARAAPILAADPRRKRYTSAPRSPRL